MSEKPAEEVRVRNRNLGGPAIVLGVLLFTALGIGWLLWARGRAMNSPIPAVAVLPFRNVSGDPNISYFSDGLTIELTDALSKVEKLRVVSWNSASRFRDKAGSLQELRDQLQAGSVVDGSVRRQGDRLRVTAKLVDTHGGETIWSDDYERNESDIFRIQEEIAKSIVYALKVPLRVDPQRILVPPRTDSMVAYDDYLRARSFRNQFSREGLQKSSEYAEKAIAGDPKYPPPYALLASNYAFSSSDSTTAKKAKTLAKRAIALDSSSGEAHTALGIAMGLVDWDLKGAGVELERAVQWSPGSADAHSALALSFLAPMGQFEGAEYEARKAMELDPLSYFANFAMARILMARGKYLESIDRFKAALSIDDQFADAHWEYGIALAAAGRKDDARAEFVKSCELLQGKDCGPGPVGLALLGDLERSRALLASEPGTPIEQARAWAVLGEADRAFAALNKAVAEHDPQLIFIQADPRFAKLRGDPRYGALLLRLKLRE